ncbi:GAF domain-containing protein [Actinoplanes sp. NPDC023714]|uniref:GAF domain-containing protein n=1 Tax=Actinoplanes sp. NPDC023714 TaxID=3154322 RepID=UPI00340D9D79
MPLDQHALTESLHALSASAATSEGIGAPDLVDRLGQVLTAARDLIHVDGTGLMLLDTEDELRIAGTSDPAATALEQAQLVAGTGPGVDCVREDRTVAVDDLADSADYAAVWESLAADPGNPVRAVLSVPVRVGGVAVGTLNAMLSRAEPWSTERIRAAEAYAGIIAVLLRLGAAQRTSTSRLRLD